MATLSRRRFLDAAAALGAGALGALPAGSALEAAVPPTLPPLRRRVLGRTGLRVTELGAGCEAVADVAVLRRALDLGVNFFDTARSYQGGNNESFLRAALGTRRKEVVLCTRSYAKDARSLAADLDASLEALGVEQVDVWYIGNRNDPAEVGDELLEVQQRAQRAGKLRFRGISVHALHRMTDFILGHGFDVVQVPYNFAIGTRRDPLHIDGASLDESLARLAAAGIGVVAMKVMAGGYGGRRPDDPLYETYRDPGAHAAALRWALRDARVQTTSVRMVDTEQLEANVRAAASAYSQRDERVLAAHAAAIAPRYCRFCGGCATACGRGLDVATLVRCVSYADGYGAYGMGAERWRGLSPARRDVRCDECAACPVECPNGVQVREMLLRARALYS